MFGWFSNKKPTETAETIKKSLPDDAKYIGKLFMNWTETINGKTNVVNKSYVMFYMTEDGRRFVKITGDDIYQSVIKEKRQDIQLWLGGGPISFYRSMNLKGQMVHLSDTECRPDRLHSVTTMA